MLDSHLDSSNQDRHILLSPKLNPLRAQGFSNSFSLLLNSTILLLRYSRVKLYKFTIAASEAWPKRNETRQDKTRQEERRGEERKRVESNRVLLQSKSSYSPTLHSFHLSRKLFTLRTTAARVVAAGTQREHPVEN